MGKHDMNYGSTATGRLPVVKASPHSGARLGELSDDHLGVILVGLRGIAGHTPELELKRAEMAGYIERELLRRGLRLSVMEVFKMVSVPRH